MEYHYPIDLDMSKQEMMDVVAFFNQIEAYYESKVERQQLLEHYRRFKEIVPSKAEEKRMFKSFEKASGYKCYQVVKEARANDEQKYLSKSE